MESGCLVQETTKIGAIEKKVRGGEERRRGWGQGGGGEFIQNLPRE